MNRAGMVGRSPSKKVHVPSAAAARHRAVGGQLDRPAASRQRANALALRMIERNRPAGAAARAGMAAAVRRMKAETLRHRVFNHRNADYRTVAAPAARCTVSPCKYRRIRPGAGIAIATGIRHVGTGYFRTPAAPRARAPRHFARNHRHAAPTSASSSGRGSSPTTFRAGRRASSRARSCATTRRRSASIPTKSSTTSAGCSRWATAARAADPRAGRADRPRHRRRQTIRA